MHEQILSPASPLLDGIKENVSSAVASGTILIIAGTIALISPLVAGLSITLIVGVMLATGGIGQCMLALKAGAFGRGLLMFIMGLLMTIAGSYMAIQAAFSAVRRLGGRRPVLHQDVLQRMLALIHRYYCNV